MKKILMGLVILVIMMLGSVLILKSKAYNFYDNYEQTDTLVKDEDKYVTYFYSSDDPYTKSLTDDVQNFAELVIDNGIGFYLVDMDDKSNQNFYADETEQSGEDYPVTPEQANSSGLNNFVIGGTPELVYIEDKKIKNIGVGIETSDMGNSYISIQETMEEIADANGFEYQATYNV